MIRAAVLALLVLLGGCERPAGEIRTARADTTMLYVYTDDDTGCEYIGQRTSAAGITPRIAADGKTHMGCNGEKP